MIRQAIEKVVELANAKENAQLEQAEIRRQFKKGYNTRY